MLHDRETVMFGGMIDLVKPGLGEYRVQSVRVRDLPIPGPAIPRLLARLDRSPRPAGVHDDGMPLVIPAHIGDVRIKDGKVTLYKTVP